VFKADLGKHGLPGGKATAMTFRVIEAKKGGKKYAVLDIEGRRQPVYLGTYAQAYAVWAAFCSKGIAPAFEAGLKAGWSQG
jgi:hypothetical protein